MKTLLLHPCLTFPGKAWSTTGPLPTRRTHTRCGPPSHASRRCPASPSAPSPEMNPRGGVDQGPAGGLAFRGSSSRGHNPRLHGTRKTEGRQSPPPSERLKGGHFIYLYLSERLRHTENKDSIVTSGDKEMTTNVDRSIGAFPPHPATPPAKGHSLPLHYTVDHPIHNLIAVIYFISYLFLSNTLI